MIDSEQVATLIKPVDAQKMMQDNPSVLLVDVRSDMEFLMIGHPEGAVNVAWIDHPEWTVNPNFVPAVRKLMLGRLSSRERAQVSIILICRSGNRSLAAAGALQSDGITDLYVVEGGFEGPLDDNHHRNTIAGWRFAGLPWVQC